VALNPLIFDAAKVIKTFDMDIKKPVQIWSVNVPVYLLISKNTMTIKTKMILIFTPNLPFQLKENPYH